MPSASVFGALKGQPYYQRGLGQSLIELGLHRPGAAWPAGPSRETHVGQISCDGQPHAPCARLGSLSTASRRVSRPHDCPNAGDVFGLVSGPMATGSSCLRGPRPKSRTRMRGISAPQRPAEARRLGGAAWRTELRNPRRSPTAGWLPRLAAGSKRSRPRQRSRSRGSESTRSTCRYFHWRSRDQSSRQ